MGFGFCESVCSTDSAGCVLPGKGLLVTGKTRTEGRLMGETAPCLSPAGKQWGLTQVRTGNLGEEKLQNTFCQF